MAVFPLSQIPVAPAAERLLIKSSQSVQTSQFSGGQSVVQHYSSWTLEVSWPRVASATKADALAAWLDQLQGSYGTFKWTPASGKVTVGATLTTTTTSYPGTNIIEVGGWGANAATNLRVGAYVQLATQLLRISAVPTNAGTDGRAQIEFNPALRSQMAAGQTLITTNPTGIFRLTPESEGSGYQIDPDRVPEFSKMTAMEVIQ